MDRRTYESPMEWEYQDKKGPLDASSPFSHVAKNQASQNPFASPDKFGARPNPFAQSPSKPLPPLPQTSLFSPRLQHSNNAPAFRNPAFTTPRKPFDESIISEAESSPALTEASDFPNDTPDVDRSGDVNMGAITPSKVDKNLRYSKLGFQAKKHASGKGEIVRAGRDYPALRKRKRYNTDRDVASLRYHSSRDDTEVDSDDYENEVLVRRKSGLRKKDKQRKGWFMTIVDIINQHPNMPDNLSRWITLLVNVSVISVFAYFSWSLWSTVRNDIFTANEAAKREIINRALECNDHYIANECVKKDRPALRVACEKWDECRIQDPESIMVVKNTAKQVAVVINEFASTMELRGFIFLFGILFLCLGLNQWNGTPNHGAKLTTPVPPTPAPAGGPPHPSGFPDASSQAYMWVPVQTPSHRRQVDFDTEATDTDDASSPVRKTLMPPPQTPSKRQSPTKESKSRSPVKLGRTPGRGF